MTDAKSAPLNGAAEPRRTRKWVSLLAEAPYFAIVIIGIIGVCWTSFFRRPSADYWVIMTPVTALLCIAVGFHRMPHGRGRLETVAIQLAQWAAVLVAMYLINISNVGGLTTSDALGGMMLTLLALGVFISGLDLRAWRLGVAGLFLAIAVPLVAWFEQAALFLVFIGAVLIALGLIFWWARARLA
ncbi:MAG TPA: hypothetical protein VF886_12925 [Roseiarcus sp.]